MNLKEQFEEKWEVMASKFALELWKYTKGGYAIFSAMIEKYTRTIHDEAYEQGRKDSLEFREKLRQLYVKSHGKNLPMEAVEMGVLARTQTLKEIREVVVSMDKKLLPGSMKLEAYQRGQAYNLALSDLLTKLNDLNK